jgi:hypothetical protein
MEIYTLLEEWRRAVSVLEQLIETESGKDKAPATWSPWPIFSTTS